jgi:hypothetical protein
MLKPKTAIRAPPSYQTIEKFRAGKVEQEETKKTEEESYRRS